MGCLPPFSTGDWDFAGPSTVYVGPKHPLVDHQGFI